jgi:hypothetical protein
MKKILIIGLLFVSCNEYQGQPIEEGVYICTGIIETESGFHYEFCTRQNCKTFSSKSDKWQIGDTL